MLSAALRDGSAHRRTTFELFARRLPDGRRYGVVAGTGRFLEALPQFRFDDAALAIAGRTSSTRRPWTSSATSGSAATSTATPKASCTSRTRPCCRCAGSFAECVLLETLALSIFNHDTAIASAAARMVSAAEGRTADRDGLAAHPRAGRGRRRPGRLPRRLRRLIQPGGQPQLRRSGAGHQRACVHHAAHRRRRPRRARRVPRAGRRAGRRHHAAGRHLRRHHRHRQRGGGRRDRASARCASTPATWACWPARPAHNSTAWAPPGPRSWCRATSTSTRSPRCAPNPSTATASAPRW